MAFRLIALWAMLLVGLAIGWLLSASWIFLYISGLRSTYHDPLAWITYAQTYGGNRWVQIYLACSALIPGAAVVAVLTIVIRLAYVSSVKRRLKTRSGGRITKIERGPTDNHGHSAWMSFDHAHRLFPGQNIDYGGVVVGQDDKGDLLIDPCDRMGTSGHSAQIAGPGGFKTASMVTTAVTWKGSSVVHDPSCELGPMLAPSMQDSGKSVFILSLNRPENEPNWGVNVLDWIDIKHPEASTHIHTVVGWIFGRTPGQSDSSSHQFFRQWGKELVACLLAHMLWSASDENPIPTLEVLREGVSQPQSVLIEILAGIHGDGGSPSPSHMARQLAGTLLGPGRSAPETFSGIYANANQGTGWLSNPAACELVSGNAFRTSDLVNERITVFVQIPLASLIHTPSVARVIIGALFNSVIMADGGGNQKKVLFLLDEAARLGRMDVVEVARDAGRKYGIVLHTLWQSIGQLDEIWSRDGRKAWIDSLSWLSFAAVQNLEVAKEISEMCGTYGVMAYSEGDNSGRQSSWASFGRGNRSRGRQVNKHEIKRPVIMPAEVIAGLDKDEAIVFARGEAPLLCRKAAWFRHPGIACRVEKNRFAA